MVDTTLGDASRYFALRPEETERLFKISARVNAGLSVEEILNAVFDEFRPILPYDRMEYTHLADGGQHLVTVWVRTTYDAKELGVGAVVQPSIPMGEHLGAGAPPFLENDVADYARRRPPGHPAHQLLAEGIRAVMNCPMVVDEKVIGMLFIASRSETFDDRHIQLFRHVGSQIAGAIAQSRLREELERKNADLQLLHQQRSTLLASISHELRNPLTSVVGLSATLRDSLPRLGTEEAQAFAGILARESDEVVGIVEDLLTVARRDAGRLDISSQETDLRAQAERVLQVWTDPDRSISLTGDSPTAMADPLRVRQILRNLVSNAFKYGGRTIRISLGSDNGYATLAVTDDGQGVPKDDWERIFEIYGTGANSAKRGDAVGLGLAVSRQLAEAMGGDLKYRFENGESKFVLRLPKT